MPSPVPVTPGPASAVALPPHVCVIGGGFGGLYTALYLDQRCRRARQPCTITLIEPRDRFTFTPLLYELLTDEVQPWEIAPPYATLLQGSTIRQLQTAATHLDLATQTVHLANGTAVSFDYGVVATGSRDRPLPIPGWQDYTYRFRTLADVEQLTERLTGLATTSSRPIQVALIGAGPSGVELACKLADYLGPRGHLSLIELGDGLLKRYPVGMQRAAGRSLTRRRVDLWLETTVTAIEPTALSLQTPSGPHTLAVDVVIGTAGTQPQPWLDSATGERPLIQPTLQLPTHPRIFVVGDQAVMPWQPDRPAPQTAQAAYQAAATAAENVLRSLQGRSLKPFRYQHLGEMMTLGKQDALVASAGLVLQGRGASCLRQLAYTSRLPPGGGHRWRVVGDRLRRACRQLWP